MREWKSKTNMVALAEIADHAMTRGLPWASHIPVSGFHADRSRRISLYRVVASVSSMQYPESCHSYGLRWFVKSTDGRFISVDAILKDQQLIGCSIHGAEITSNWLATLHRLERRKGVSAAGMEPGFLSVPAYRLEFISFYRGGLSQEDLLVGVDALGHASLRVPWLRAFELVAVVRGAAQEFQRRTSSARGKSRN